VGRAGEVARAREESDDMPAIPVAAIAVTKFPTIRREIMANSLRKVLKKGLLMISIT
jgi:hypothetical protein